MLEPNPRKYIPSLKNIKSQLNMLTIHAEVEYIPSLKNIKSQLKRRNEFRHDNISPL